MTTLKSVKSSLMEIKFPFATFLLFVATIDTKYGRVLSIDATVTFPREISYTLSFSSPSVFEFF